MPHHKQTSCRRPETVACILSLLLVAVPCKRGEVHVRWMCLTQMMEPSHRDWGWSIQSAGDPSPWMPKCQVPRGDAAWYPPGHEAHGCRNHVKRCRDGNRTVLQTNATCKAPGPRVDDSGTKRGKNSTRWMASERSSPLGSVT